VVARGGRGSPIPVCRDEIGRKHAPILDREDENRLKKNRFGGKTSEMKLSVSAVP
jgi:hypothetical protein